MTIVSNERPGVYSTYEVAPSYGAAASRSYGAVVAKASGGTPGELRWISTSGGLREFFGEDREDACLARCVQLLLDGGVSRVAAVSAGEDYPGAFALLEAEENIGAVICDSDSPEVLQALADSARRASQSRRERVAFAGVEQVQRALELAALLNSERLVICCPAAACAGERDGEKRAVFAACALAGRVLALGDPGYSLNGLELPQITRPERLDEATIQELLAGGVTVVESVGEKAECIRALTTKTKTGSSPDRSRASLSTVLIIDDVLASVRAALFSRLKGSRISGGSLESILSQVTVELAAKRDQGLLESFQPPRVYPLEGDPAVCVVELSFQVAAVLSRIHVVAHVQV